MTSAGPDLDLAQEKGRESRKLLSGTGALNKLSQHQNNKRGRNLDRPSRDKGHYCGNKSSAEIKRTRCPAFGKKCAKWKMSGIFSKQFMKMRALNTGRSRTV